MGDGPPSSPVGGVVGLDDLGVGLETVGTERSKSAEGAVGRVFLGPPALVVYSVALLGLVGWSIATFVSDQVQNAEFARTGVIIHPRIVRSLPRR